MIDLPFCEFSWVEDAIEPHRIPQAFLDQNYPELLYSLGIYQFFKYSGGMKSILLIVCVLLTACYGSNQVARGPDGPRLPSTRRPAPPNVPIINLPESNVATHWTATPTIIDTSTFAVQHQLTGPSAGPHIRPATMLPPHRQPKDNRPSPPNTLRVGFGNNNTAIHDEGGFEAIVQTPWSPPDPSLAVGPNHVVVTVNMAIAFYDKAGNEQFSANLDSTGNPGFFEEIGAGSFTFDPKCFYDPHTQRFVVLALEQYGSSESWITIAVSDDDDPNGVWYKYRTWSVISNGGDTFWVDYPGFGFDENYFYVTGNLFGLNNGGWAGVLYRVFDKTPMLVGDPVVIADVRMQNHASMQGAQQHGNSPAAFFVGRRGDTEIRLTSISNPANPTVIQELIPVPSNDTPGNVSNPGGSVDALDGRLMNAQYRDGSLWTAHGIDGDGIAVVGRWYEIDLSDWPNTSPILAQSGDLDIPNNLSSFFPAIAPNRRGEAAIVVATANSSSNPSLHIIGRKSGDTLGVMGTSTQVAIGSFGGDGRWGDYFDMTVDPNNDVRFWYVGEYETAAGWQTYIGSAIITCIEDVDADGNITVTDLLSLIAAWGTGGDGADIAAPYDVVDISDLLGVVAAFGGCP